MSATPPESVITATFGPFVTGIVLQTLFLGVFLTQVYDYFRIFPKDSYYYKGTVAARMYLPDICMRAVLMHHLVHSHRSLDPPGRHGLQDSLP
jgi:hypothetical protein